MSTTKPRRTAILLAGLAVGIACTFSAAPVQAQTEAAKDKARDLFRQGKTQYDLGNFDRAIELFKEAYEIHPFENLLFNIAQAYRQQGDCQALFFYKRYLTVTGGKANNTKLVESRIKELTKTCRDMDDLKEKPPPGAMPPDPDNPPTGGPGNRPDGDDDDDDDDPTGPEVAENDDDDDDDDDDDETTTDTGIYDTAQPRPSRVATSVELGPAFLDIGDLDISGTQFALAIGAEYPVHFGQVGVTAGALLTYTPVPWDNGAGLQGTSGLTGLLANVGAHYWAMENISVHARVGIGGLVLTGLDEGSVFLNPGDIATGPITMVNIRAAASVAYFVTDNLMLSLSPFSYAYSPAREGLRTGIDAFGRIEITAGVGYRL